MIKGKTFNATNGLNYIQNSELAFATIYVVKREGLQYDKYVSGPTNRKFIHDQSIGRIYFPVLFDSIQQEKVFVVYKTPSGIEPETPPGVCEPVNILSSDMKFGLVGQPYFHSVDLSGSQPFSLSNIVKPAWAEVYPYGLNRVGISGTPTTETTETVSFDVSNGCSTSPFSQSFQVVSGTINFYVDDFLNSTIRAVTGVEYILTSGNIPTNGPAPAEGVHSGYTGIIGVQVHNIVFPLSLQLYKNEVMIESIPVPSADTYFFTSSSFLQTDSMKILLTA